MNESQVNKKINELENEIREYRNRIRSLELETQAYRLQQRISDGERVSYLQKELAESLTGEFDIITTQWEISYYYSGIRIKEEKIGNLIVQQEQKGQLEGQTKITDYFSPRLQIGSRYNLSNNGITEYRRKENGNQKLKQKR